MIHRLILLLLFFVPIVSCTKPLEKADERSSESTEALGLCGENLRITNGVSCNKVSESSIAILQIEIQGQPGGLCSGALITDRTILTAAHCLDRDQGVTGLLVGFPSSKASSERTQFEVYKVASFMTHRLWDSHPGNPYDIGIAILEKAVENRVPIPLVGPSYASVKIGDYISIYGYGKDENEQVGELKRGVMKLESFDTGLLYPDSLLGASFDATRQSICSGDSGGPAGFQTKNGMGIVAVNSVGTSEKCLDGDMAGFANLQLPENYDFIMEAKEGELGIIGE